MPIAVFVFLRCNVLLLEAAPTSSVPHVIISNISPASASMNNFGDYCQHFRRFFFQDHDKSCFGKKEDYVK
jgi:hypothetical protein